MTILAIVNADKEGQIESKMMKSRHLEEIREARRNEMEARQSEKKSKLVWAFERPEVISNISSLIDSCRTRPRILYVERGSVN